MASAAVTAAVLAMPGPAVAAPPDEDAVAYVASPRNLLDFTALGNTLYFGALDEAHGRELWKSDGTLEGTRLVADIFPGPDGEGRPDILGAHDGLVYFTAYDGVHGRELWTSDGTSAGTRMLKDLVPGAGDAFSRIGSAEMIEVGGQLFFTASGGGHGQELFTSDGTSDGTVLVADIDPTGNGAPSGLTDLGGILYFSADDGVNGRELWKSDGTTAGTVLVADINPADDYGGPSSDPSGLTDVGGTLYFSADDGEHGEELWKSDGTISGTVLVKDIDPGFDGYSGYPLGSEPHELTDVGGTLFFAADSPDHGRELWKSDGTTSGTVQVEDIKPGDTGSPYDSPLGGYPRSLTELEGSLYFIADDGVHGWELWRSDGTAGGTRLVREINPSDDADFDFPPIGALLPVDDALYFSADDEKHGWELWRSDGTAAGTTLVNDLNPRGDSTNPFNERAVVGHTLFFEARRTDVRPSLWKIVRNPLRATCDGVLATIRGSGRITGTAGVDVIVGSRGKDAINGRGGDDIICAGPGDDTVVGRGGDDDLYGRAGNDRLVGGNGRDRIAGDRGADHLDLRDRVRGNDRGDGGRGRDAGRSDPGDVLRNVP